MADQSHSSRAGVPLGDLTNTYQTVPHGERREEDSKARKSQMDREHYAKMSREKKDERNRKNRERRMKKKGLAIGISSSMGENEDNGGLHGAQFFQINNLPVDIVPCVESQENEDSKARKSQVDRERYEKLSREKKDERNRKDRERRMKTKALAIDISASMDDNEDGAGLQVSHLNQNTELPAMDQDNDWDHMGHLTHHSDLPGVSVPMNEDEDTDWLHRGHLTGINDLPDWGEVLISADTVRDCIHGSSIDSTIAEGGKIKCLIILCMGWCSSSTWFVSIHSSRGKKRDRRRDSTGGAIVEDNGKVNCTSLDEDDGKGHSFFCIKDF